MHTGVSFWPNRTPTGDLAHVDWIVRAPEGSTIGLAAWHDRAGRVTTSVELKR
jgi:hypothetical protein